MMNSINTYMNFTASALGMVNLCEANSVQEKKICICCKYGPKIQIGEKRFGKWKDGYLYKCTIVGINIIFHIFFTRNKF